MYPLGIDLGTSSVKVAVLDAMTRKTVASASYPEQEAPIISKKEGWAEQSPIDWWKYTQKAIFKVNASGLFDPKKISSIGIAYQMHGLVVVDKDQNLLRDSIIWCDSRAIEFGEQAFQALGQEHLLGHLLNSPGNFTASKLAWVKANEPEIYQKIDKIMLPGDFIAMKLSGKITTTIPALSEGVFWDFKKNIVSSELMEFYGFHQTLIPDIKPLFSEHGRLMPGIARLLGLREGISISYKSVDQPNNALSLNVLKPGEVAATAGTSGVIYGVSDDLTYDKKARVNTFAHVNYTPENKHTGVLLCINGTGSMYRWAKDNFSAGRSYKDLNELAAIAPIGSKGLTVLPFGNGAERMLGNKFTGCQLLGIDLNSHRTPEIFRAVQESIAFSFRYGLYIMREIGMQPEIIKAGNANLFLSDLFAQIFVDVLNVPLEIYENDGSTGAALGAGIGSGIFKDYQNAFSDHKPLKTFMPKNTDRYEQLYQQWNTVLSKTLEIL